MIIIFHASFKLNYLVVIKTSFFEFLFWKSVHRWRNLQILFLKTLRIWCRNKYFKWIHHYFNFSFCNFHYDFWLIYRKHLNTYPALYIAHRKNCLLLNHTYNQKSCCTATLFLSLSSKNNQLHHRIQSDFHLLMFLYKQPFVIVE